MRNKPRKSNKTTFMTLLNFIVDPAVIVDEKGRFLVVNDAFTDLTGLIKKELIGTAFLEVSILPAESKAILLKNLKKRMQGLPVEPYEINFTDKTGKARCAELKAKKIDYAGQPADLVIFRDITRRKENARRLKEYSEKMEALVTEKVREIKDYLDVASVMFVALDTKGSITMLNQKGCEILKCTAEEAFGKNWFDNFLPKKVKSDVKRRFKLILTGKAGFSEYHENPVLAKNGDIRLIWWHHTVLRNNDGRIIGALSSGEDITEWKQAQQALTDSEEMFRAISTSAMDAIILVDKRGKIVYWNPAAERIFGYTQEEAVGKDVLNLLIPPRDHSFQPKFVETLQSSKQIQGKTMEFTALRKDGREFPAELSATLLRFKGKSCLLGIVRDVSERRKMEAELKQERDMLEAVTENIGAGLVIISKDYHALWANNFIKRYKGDVEGKLCYATLNTLDAPCPDCGVKKIFEDGATIDAHEYCSTTIDGKPYWVEIIATPIKDKDGNVIAALELAVDITEKKNLQGKLAEYSQKLEKLVEKRTEQLKQTQAKLVKSERLATIGELAAMVGHDLRNPLTGIMGAAYYLKTKHGTEVGAKGKEMLETIENAINYSNKIMNDLLEYSRDLKLKLTETTPKAMLQSALSLLEVPENIQVVDATENEPMVKADTEKIRKVFVNIIQNAIDVMPEGGTLTIKSRKVKGKLEIAFKDTGTGMSEETLSNLEGGVPLFTTKAKGMGFGLPICKRIAEAHGGKIRVKSAVGKGTTVTVTIPVNPEPVNEGEEKWIFSESMLSAITSTQRAP